MERWLKIPEFDGYEVSDKGRVRSIDRFVVFERSGEKRKAFRKGVVLKQKDIRGYKNVTLRREGKKKTLQIHRIVLKNFKPNKNQDKLQVNHVNGLKGDNRIENLEWVTPSENTKHAFSKGLISQTGSKNNASKLTEKDVVEIRTKYKNLSESKTAKIYNVSPSLIGLVKRRKIWKHV